MVKATCACEICLLAGGLSSRMGFDKSRLRLGRHSLRTLICDTASGLALPLRIVWRDLVPRCGPLGGIYTALKRSRAEAQLFLACDMPFMSLDWLKQLCAHFQGHQRAVFTAIGGRAGFPFLLPRRSLAVVEKQILEGEFSIQELAQALKATRLRPAPNRLGEFLNVNTPEEWEVAQARWKASHDASGHALPDATCRRIIRP